METFGFHLAELEVRQHSQVHADALAEMAAGRTSERTEEVLATIRTIAWIQERFGVTACSRYVVSFTRSADDIAAVYALAEHALGGRAPQLDVVPLFESGADLAAAPAVLSGMLKIPAVQARLAADRRLEVMLGYSDSAKELGPAAATLKLYEAQEALTAWSDEHDVPLTLFHGRGGALGRGGGPANRAVLAQAPGSVGGRFKVTEQGEVIFARYGHDAIARRHMEQVTSAVLLASTPSIGTRTAEAAGRFRGVAEQVASASEKAYRLLTEAPGLPRVVLPGQPAGGDRITPSRLPPGPARPRRAPVARRPAGHPVGVRLGPDPGQPARLVRPGQRPGGRDLRVRPGRAARRLPRVAAVRLAAGQRGDVAGQDRPATSPPATSRSAPGTTSSSRS